jgi:hypothetical protein
MHAMCGRIAGRAVTTVFPQRTPGRRSRGRRRGPRRHPWANGTRPLGGRVPRAPVPVACRPVVPCDVGAGPPGMGMGGGPAPHEAGSECHRPKGGALHPFRDPQPVIPGDHADNGLTGRETCVSDLRPGTTMGM